MLWQDYDMENFSEQLEHLNMTDKVTVSNKSDRKEGFPLGLVIGW